MNDRLKPTEAETATIGGVLLNNDILPKLNLEASDFWDPKNQTIWRSILELGKSGTPIDVVTLKAEILRYPSAINEKILGYDVGGVYLDNLSL